MEGWIVRVEYRTIPCNMDQHAWTSVASGYFANTLRCTVRRWGTEGAAGDVVARVGC